MTNEVVWIKLETFNAGYQADIVVELLHQADIPTLVQGPEAGIYGFGFGGMTAKGVTIKVPSDRLQEARDLLEASSTPDTEEPDE